MVYGSLFLLKFIQVIFQKNPTERKRFYDIIAAKEKQAAPKETFVFHAVINEKAFDEVKQKVR